MSQRKAKHQRQQQRATTAIDRAHVQRLHAELTEQYMGAVAVLDQARANANAIKGAMQFAERLLTMPGGSPPPPTAPPVAPPPAAGATEPKP